MSVRKTLIEILKSELCDEGPIPKPDPNEYPALFALSKKHDIAHIVASALSKAGALYDDDISKKFKKQLLLALYRREQQNHVVSQISEVFEKEKIPHVLLKGSILCEYYPQDWLRSSCDVDILVDKSDLSRATDMLLAKGYTFFKTPSEYDCSLFSPAGVHVELHFSLFLDACPEKTNLVLSSVSDYTEKGIGAPYKRQMSNEMFILYHIAHMANHFIKGGCGMRPFADLLIINRKMPFDREKLNGLLHSAGLFEFYIAANELLSVWFEHSEYTKAAKLIENFVISGGVYGSESNATVMKAAKGEGKVRSFASIAFMPRKNLELIYPNLEKHPSLLPFYEVKRWFRIFDKSKRERVKRHTQMRNSVSQSKAEETAELLSLLGLR